MLKSLVRLHIQFLLAFSSPLKSANTDENKYQNLQEKVHFLLRWDILIHLHISKRGQNKVCTYLYF
jgi:hypothetical protein